jgi:hypothetical protein
MEAMLGISLYNYPYLKLAKTLYLSYYGLCLLFNKIGEKGRIGSAWKHGWWGGRNGPNNICTYEEMNNNFKKVLTSSAPNCFPNRKSY